MSALPAAPAAPTFTEKQRAALMKGNEYREQRGQLRRNITAGHVDALDVLRDPPPYAATMYVFDLLKLIPGVGQSTVDKVFTAAGVSPRVRLAGDRVGITLRQRAALIAALDKHRRAA